MNRRGFTFIELLIVLAVVGILTMLGILRYIDLRNHAIASGVVSELNAIRLATYNYWADRNSFPPDAGSGITPPALEPYLRANFEFSRTQYTFDYENFGGTADNGASAGLQVGIVVTTVDDGLAAILARRAAGGLPYFMVGNTLTYVIVGPDGRM
ncbi:MAG TPA: type II secretion system protein [Gemmatimonadales bacterium]